MPKKTVTKPTLDEVEAIKAAFVLAVADATREACLRFTGLLPPPSQEVLTELASREAALETMRAEGPATPTALALLADLRRVAGLAR